MKLDREQIKMGVILDLLGFSLVLFIDFARAQTIGARFEKVVLPLHTDLENAFILARWTQSPMYCALECIQTDGCQSFLYTNEVNISHPTCYDEHSHHEYVGTRSTTFSGKTCQAWSSQAPHAHSNTDDDYFPDDSVTRASNYCRDPDNSGYLWCFTTAPDQRWEPCGITSCSYVLPLELCYSTTSHKEYTGTWNMTMTGASCQRWDSQTPHDHSNDGVHLFPDATLADAANYCRDPDDGGFLWCYTTDENIRWQPCGIPRCKNQCMLYNTIAASADPPSIVDGFNYYRKLP